MDPQSEMNPSELLEIRQRCHRYLMVAGVNCLEERECLILSSLNSGKDPLVALHATLLEEQREKNPPIEVSSPESCMSPKPFRFFWETRRPRTRLFQATKRSAFSESFLTGVRGRILNAVRTR